MGIRKQVMLEEAERDAEQRCEHRKLLDDCPVCLALAAIERENYRESIRSREVPSVATREEPTTYGNRISPFVTIKDLDIFTERMRAALQEAVRPMADAQIRAQEIAEKGVTDRLRQNIVATLFTEYAKAFVKEAGAAPQGQALRTLSKAAAEGADAVLDVLQRAESRPVITGQMLYEAYEQRRGELDGGYAPRPMTWDQVGIEGQRCWNHVAGLFS